MRCKNLRLGKGTILFFFSIFALGFFFGNISQAISAPKVVKWDVSFWAGPQEWTYSFERFAKNMERLTNGGWQIKLHYGSALGPPKEQIDGIKAGMFQACMFCAFYTPAKLPLHTVIELPFINGRNVLENSLLVKALWEHPAVLKELERWNAAPFWPVANTNYTFMGNKRIANLEDLKGIRVRMSGQVGKLFKRFGVVPTFIPGTEIYEALARGTIDMVTFPYPNAMAHFKLHEASKYTTTGLTVGTSACTFVCSKKAYDALPEEYKKLHKEWYAMAPYEGQRDIDDCYAKWMPEFRKRLEFVPFSPEGRLKIMEKAELVWEEWVETWESKGVPAREVLEYFLAKRAEIVAR